MSLIAGREHGVPDSLSPDMIALLPRDVAQRYKVVPCAFRAGVLLLWCVDDETTEMGELEFLLETRIEVVAGQKRAIENLWHRYFSEESPTSAADVAWAKTELEQMASQAPVVQMVNRVFTQAVREKASDIHFEPFETMFRIRIRVDGVLKELPSPAREFSLAVVSRIKVLANLDIAERRVPQDGRLKMTLGGHAVDLRVSTLPTQFGESVVLRVLDQTAVQLSLAQLGMSEGVLAGVRAAVRRPNGIFIVTGPTGSGKTTTLYSALSEINLPDTKILTAEDPVEYEIEGLMQVPVNPSIGFDFSTALRSFLRSDPDVLMVGEIRDRETAQMAIQAALTGHVVLATLHTNDAPGAVTRLIEMGIEPFLIAETITGVVAQRLVRRTCSACHGNGCETCAGGGFRGRVGLFEWLPISAGIRELIGMKTSAQVLRGQALAEGMISLKECARLALAQQLTTADELRKIL